MQSTSFPRRFHLGQQRMKGIVGRLAFDLQFRCQRDAVTQSRLGDIADVVWRDEIAPLQHGLRARRTDQRDAAARTRAQ